MDYYFSKETDLSFDVAIEKVKELLKKEGFGVLTEIDIKATLKNKLDVDFKIIAFLGHVIHHLLIKHCRQKIK